MANIKKSQDLKAGDCILNERGVVIKIVAKSVPDSHGDYIAKCKVLRYNAPEPWAGYDHHKTMFIDQEWKVISNA